MIEEALRPIYRELHAIRDDLEDLRHRVKDMAGYRKEIDYVYKPRLDLTVSVWMGGRVYGAAIVRQRSFFPPQSALCQGRSASAFCQNTNVPGAVCSC